MLDYKKVLEGEEFYHRYLYDKNDKRVGVIVAICEEDNGKKKFSFGYSICAKGDNFNKKYGKALALLRAKSGKADIMKIPTKIRAQADEKILSMLERLVDKYDPAY